MAYSFDPNKTYSTNASVGEKTSSASLADKISSGLGNISLAAQTGAAKASLAIKSAFEKKDLSLPKSATNVASTPEEKRISNPVFAQALLFPAEMKYFTMFSFKAYQKVGATDTPTSQSSVTIVLPLPANLQEQFAVDYDTPSFGPIVGAASNAVINAFRPGGGGLGEVATKAAALGVSGFVEAGEAGILNQMKSAGGASETMAQLATQALGVAPNPHMAVIFRNIGLRQHSFSYKFAPRSQAELNTLKRIIRELKVRMLPGMTSQTDTLFTFPDTCKISFGPNKDIPYTMKECVLESLSVNYSPGGSPAFFKTGDPVMVEINMSFKEMSPFTRADVTKPEAIAEAAKVTYGQTTSAAPPTQQRTGASRAGGYG